MRWSCLGKAVTDYNDATGSLAYALGSPTVTGVLRASNRDFQVEEGLDVQFSKHGEFDWLWVEKCGENTAFIARQLAKLAGVGERKVTYSGLKDRHALTRQWFCVHLPGKQGRDWQDCERWQQTDPDNPQQGWQILRWGRHRQKLRIGSHRHNRFLVQLRDLDGDLELLEPRVALLRRGFPNYFGEQRFGHSAGNLAAAHAWARGEKTPRRQQQGLVLSAARSAMFNSVLNSRLAHGNWNRGLSGELFCLRDSNSVFRAEVDGQISQRLEDGDIHPTGPLYGREGKLSVSAEVAELEHAIFANYPEFCQLLLQQGLNAERRSLRVIPQTLNYQLENRVLALSFSLPKGCFATALVRELVDYQAAS